ncbi:MAG TPA: hypothetical protein VLM18_05865 [Croceibacterium sp.]|nr:hypothetical protein [Croceibacterium sp.]
MSEPDLITILHLSDYHFSRRKAREQQIIVDALFEDLEELCVGHRKPDLTQEARQHFRKIATPVAPRIAKERKLRINGILYEVQAPQSMSDNALLKQMLLRLPAAHIKMIASVLGSEKLRRQLTEPTLEDAEEPNIIKLFRVGLISELQFDETPSAVSELALALREHPYLLWSLILHLGELRRMDHIRPEHQDKLIEPTALAIANLFGGSSKSRENQKRQQVAKLKREQLLLTLKRDK